MIRRLFHWLLGHRYVSTACEHEMHFRCRHTCKFCKAPCLCGCHGARR